QGLKQGNNDIPAEINGLLKQAIVATTHELDKPWLLSVFDDNAGIVAFDDEDAFCVKVETHNAPSALDPYGGALTGIVGVNRDILGCGLGAKPIFNTDVFCVAPLDYEDSLPERVLHPRRILEGVRSGVEHGGNKSGIPTVNGALVFDERYLGRPLVYCGTGGFMPRVVAGRRCELKEIKPGDRIFMVGGRIGKDGIHGATFSSLAIDDNSPISAVQLGDPITQKRAMEFILEARDAGLYRAITDNGAGGLSSSVGEMAKLSGGARLDVSRAKVKYHGLKPYELVVSESQERMTIAVPPENIEAFVDLAGRRGVEVGDLGEFTDSGRFEIWHAEKIVGSLDLSFLHDGLPQLELYAEWKGCPAVLRTVSNTAGGGLETDSKSFENDAQGCLLSLLSRPNIASKEWLIRQYDHEVQGTSVVKPLHTVFSGTSLESSGPNDASVIKPKPYSDSGLVIGCGINPKLSDIDPYLMAQAAVDEALRNILCVGAGFGREDSVVALVDNFCWPDPVGDPEKTAWLVRACYGLRAAAKALSVPFVSGKDSMKNDFRGMKDGAQVTISIPPTLLVTAVAKIPDIKEARSADFKSAGDVIYLLGNEGFGLLASELDCMEQKNGGARRFTDLCRTGEPNWEKALKTYRWLGGATGSEQSKLRSVHDVSDGGVLVAVAEALVARGLGAMLTIPHDQDPWEFAFGEGLHSFVVTVQEFDSAAVEAEWISLGIGFRRIGVVMSQDKLEVRTEFKMGAGGKAPKPWSLSTSQLRAAWQKMGYWE
ncbi:MAG: AIR synthase-related protein, partial [Bdellovibrionota bacterium]